VDDASSIRSERPVRFTFGSVVAHILTISLVRRHTVIGVLRELEVPDAETRDPIEWERDYSGFVAGRFGRLGPSLRRALRRERLRRAAATAPHTTSSSVPGSGVIVGSTDTTQLAAVCHP
jgi:hypothetical protein